jgi:alpha-mannosidase
MLESARRLGVQLGRAADFFDRASAEAVDPATVAGELYFELHRGTYTSQARTKRLNRAAQRALRGAEMWSVAAGDYPRDELEALWKTLLLNQFHDILPGSSIDWVYEEAERDLAHVIDEAEEIAEGALRRVAGQGSEVTVFNPTSHRRAEVIAVDDALRFVEVPPCGWASERAPAAPDAVTVTERSMQNAVLRVEWDDQGLLTSIWDKEVGREVLSSKGNLLQLHDDEPRMWDAWDLDADYMNSHVDITELDEQRVILQGGLRGLVRFRRSFGDSDVDQSMWLDSASRILFFATTVNWRERHKMLKVAFPVTVASRDATYEVQFGHVRRPTHMDTPQARAMFEVCAQRWADLGDGTYGVALLNDCKHGYDVHGSVMRLSLLRAPTHPDPNADQGLHTFTYALMPHPGDLTQAGVIEAAEDLNVPLTAVHGSPRHEQSRSLVEVDTRQVIVEAIKRAEDSDATIVRLYEAWGRPCTARVRTTLPASRAYLCGLLERDRKEVQVRDGIITLELTPFKILTLKLQP